MHKHELLTGDTVLCMANGIDSARGNGAEGTIEGFARFSPYHPREAHVRLADGSTMWFWIGDLAPARGGHHA